MRYLPGDDCDIQALADELLSAGLVHLYVVDGCEYAYLPGFTKHQIINNREASSTLPAPPFAQVAQDLHVKHDASGTRESGDTHDAEGKGKEGKGKEGKGREGKGRERKSYDSDPRFSVFWDEYPNKKGKALAEASWTKLNPDDPLFDLILSRLQTAKRSRDWLKDGGEFIPMPSTWLNQRRWEDELQPAVINAVAGNGQPGPSSAHLALLAEMGIDPYAN
jgi:hypothetical protein